MGKRKTAAISSRAVYGTEDHHVAGKARRTTTAVRTNTAIRHGNDQVRHVTPIFPTIARFATPMDALRTRLANIDARRAALSVTENEPAPPPTKSGDRNATKEGWEKTVSLTDTSPGANKSTRRPELIGTRRLRPPSMLIDVPPGFYGRAEEAGMSTRARQARRRKEILRNNVREIHDRYTSNGTAPNAANRALISADKRDAKKWGGKLEVD